MPEGIDETTVPAAGPATDTAELAPGTGPGEGVPQGGDGAAGDEGDPAGAEALGDPGKKALDTMKAQRNAEREKRRELERQLEELRAPKPANEGDQPDPDAIRREAAREATKAANTRILKSEIKAAAAGRLADPKDALVYLDLSSFEVNEDGDVDTEEISEAIADLLTRKPYLAANGRPRFQGTGDGGAARKASGPSQLTRADLKGMTPDQIHKAKAEGRLNDVLGIA
jgi:hypothetical protein